MPIKNFHTNAITSKYVVFVLSLLAVPPGTVAFPDMESPSIPTLTTTNTPISKDVAPSLSEAGVTLNIVLFSSISERTLESELRRTSWLGVVKKSTV